MAGPAKRRLHLQMDGESIVIDHSKHTRLVRFSSFFLYVNLAGSMNNVSQNGNLPQAGVIIKPV